MRRWAWMLVMCWPCLVGGASRDFNGTTDLINIGSAANLDNHTALTYTAWVYVEGGGENNLGEIYTKSPAGGTTKQFRIENRGGAEQTNSLDMAIVTSGTSRQARAATDSLSFNAWHFVVTNWPGSSAPKLFIDGAEPPYATQTNGTGTDTSEANDSGIIGNRGNADRTFDGQMAYVSIHNASLSVVEQEELRYHALSIPNGIVAALPLWGNASPEVDLSGTGNAGTLTGTAESANGPPVMIGGYHSP